MIKVPNRNYFLSYDAELSYHSESFRSLARGKKRSAMFGSQPTAIIGRPFFSVKYYNNKLFHGFFLQVRKRPVVTNGKSVLKLVKLPSLKMICLKLTKI